MKRWRHLPNLILIAPLLGLAACASATIHDATYVLQP